MVDLSVRSISPILDDCPTTEDALDFTHYVDALADILLDPDTRTPLTLGIFGPWGSGKTSLMTMLKKRLDARRRQEKQQTRQGEIVRSHLSVWFNAWLYSREEALWRTLILRVLAELRREVGSVAARQLLDKMEADLVRTVEPPSLGELIIGSQALLSGSDETAEFRLPLVTGLEILQEVAEARAEAPDTEDVTQAAVTALVQTVGQMHTALRRERIEALETFRQDFQELVRKFVKPGFLVVFVDDLDRCLPEKALQVLESIKLFLDVPGCIFVLGLDPQAIQDAVRTRYRDEVKARQYLEKIIQLPFLLPPIETENMRDFVESLAPHLPDPHCCEVFAVGLLRNPRQVKRTINIFLLLWKLSRSKLPESIQPVRLAKVVAIQHGHPDLYARLREVPRLLRDLEAYFRAKADLESLPTPDTLAKDRPEMPLLPEQLETFIGRTTLRNLLTLHPADEPGVNFIDLTPQDIRPYIYLTRRVEARFETLAEVPQPEMVRILAGEFTMGGEEYNDEKPVHKVHLPDYQIGRYPVTNYEYRAFVRDTGASPPPHWEGSDYPETLGDHPVVYVTWYDAVAYCRWLGEKTGKPYRLATEAEWEKAARSSDGRKWPWGNEWDASNCNSKECGLDHTTPPGQYSPHGDSLHGVADMAGNVWEWCHNLSWPYPYRNDDGREDLKAPGERAMRGGAFSNEPDSVRCAFRLSRLPRSRDVNIGFRVALAFPPNHSKETP